MGYQHLYLGVKPVREICLSQLQRYFALGICTKEGNHAFLSLDRKAIKNTYLKKTNHKNKKDWAEQTENLLSNKLLEGWKITFKIYIRYSQKLRKNVLYIKYKEVTIRMSKIKGAFLEIRLWLLIWKIHRIKCIIKCFKMNMKWVMWEKWKIDLIVYKKPVDIWSTNIWQGS